MRIASKWWVIFIKKFVSGEIPRHFYCLLLSRLLKAAQTHHNLVTWILAKAWVSKSENNSCALHSERSKICRPMTCWYFPGNFRGFEFDPRNSKVTADFENLTNFLGNLEGTEVKQDWKLVKSWNVNFVKFRGQNFEFWENFWLNFKL